MHTQLLYKSCIKSHFVQDTCLNMLRGVARKEYMTITCTWARLCMHKFLISTMTRHVQGRGNDMFFTYLHLTSHEMQCLCSNSYYSHANNLFKKVTCTMPLLHMDTFGHVHCASHCNVYSCFYTCTDMYKSGGVHVMSRRDTSCLCSLSWVHTKKLLISLFLAMF